MTTPGSSMTNASVMIKKMAEPKINTFKTNTSIEVAAVTTEQMRQIDRIAIEVLDNGWKEIYPTTAWKSEAFCRFSHGSMARGNRPVLY